MLFATSLVVAPPARSDPVADWTEISLRTVSGADEDVWSRLHTLTLVHFAMYESLNFIALRYASRLTVRPDSPLDIPGEAAAASAAHFILSNVYPAEKAALDGLLAISLGSIRPHYAQHSGIETGRAIAANIYALRGDERFWLPNADYRARLATGRTRSRGSDAEFWSALGPLHWTARVADLIVGNKRPLLEGARINAAVSMAVSDAYIYAGMEQSNLCGSCAANAAVAVIVGFEFGDASLPSFTRTSDERRPNSESSELGRQIGKQALRYFEALERPQGR